MARVFVAMSGGVDSSVAAALLLAAGHDVTGITLSLLPGRTFEHGDGLCADSVEDARRVCDALGIRHVILDVRDAFEEAVIAPYVAAYASGRTPNPCIECNARIKFGRLLEEALKHGADRLATGHYARIEQEPNGRVRLARGADARRDQSYFLYRLAPEQMSRILFPLGTHLKKDVRAIAEEIGLHVHDREESQDACFAPDGHVVLVGQRRADALECGPVIDGKGRVLGTHRGLARYTVGQRHGLSLSGPDGPYYVIALDAARNAVIVGPKVALEVTRVQASNVVWHQQAREMRVRAQTRYRMAPIEALAHADGDTLTLELDEPVFGVARGQAVVCYEAARVVGGGTIEETS